MYHSYARVPVWVRAHETISSISSLKVSSLPSLTASSFTQEMCPFMVFSFSPCPHVGVRIRMYRSLEDYLASHCPDLERLRLDLRHQVHDQNSSKENTPFSYFRLASQVLN